MLQKDTEDTIEEKKNKEETEGEGRGIYTKKERERRTDQQNNRVRRLLRQIQ